MLYVCVRDMMEVVFSVCAAWSCRCSCMGSVSVLSCRYCMFVSCNHERGHHMEEAYSRAGLMTAFR